MSSFVSILMIISVVLTAYTAKLVCDNPYYDNLGPFMQTIRRQAGCAPLSALAGGKSVKSEPKVSAHEHAKTSASGKKPQTQRGPVIEFPDKSVPSWAKVIGSVISEEWPAHLGNKTGHTIAASRIPRLFNNAPLMSFAHIDDSFQKRDVEMWQSEQEFLSRFKPGHRAFARENYNSVIENARLIDNSSTPFFKLSITMGQMFMASMQSGIKYFAEGPIKDLEPFINGTNDQFRVHFREDLDPPPVSFENDSVVYTMSVESPGTELAAMYSPAHGFMLQLNGKRVVLLFPPEQYADLHMYPLTSPRRRQSKNDFVTPAPPQVACVGVLLNPGQVLYVPPFWTVRTSLVATTPMVASDFSISALALSPGLEQRIVMAIEDSAKPEDLLNIVAMMASAPQDFKQPQRRARAAVGLLILKLTEKAGGGSKQMLETLMERIKTPAELLTGKPPTFKCDGDIEMDKLEQEARDLIEDLAKLIADTRSLLGTLYEKKLDEGFGPWSSRAEGVWRIVLFDLIERFSIIAAGPMSDEFLQCLLDHVSHS